MWGGGLDTFAAARVIVALLLLFIVPGITWGPLLVPRIRASRLEILGRTIGTAIGVAGITATVLAVFHLLTPWVVLVSLLAVSALPLAFSSVRQELAVPRFRGRARGEWLVLIAVVALVALLVIASHLGVGSDLLPISSTVWYYQNLSVLTANASGFPATVTEWARVLDFQTDYAVFTAHSAAFLSLAGQQNVLALFEVYRLAILATVLLLCILLFSRFLPVWLAACAIVALVANPWFDIKTVGFRPEIFALAPALFAAWLFDRSLVLRSPRLAIGAALAGSVVFLSHVEVWFIWLCFVAASLASRTLWNVLRPGLPARRRLRRLATASGLAALSVAGALALGVAGNIWISGSPRIISYGNAGALADPAMLASLTQNAPQGWGLSPDLTWDFYVAAAHPEEAGNAPPTSFTDRRLLLPGRLLVWPTVDARRIGGILALSVLVIGMLLLWRFLSGRARRAIAYSIAFGSILMVGAYLITSLSSTYVPRRLGDVRLLPYEIIPLALVVGLAMMGLTAVLVRGLHGRSRRLGIGAASIAALLVVTLGTGLLTPSGLRRQYQPGLSQLGYEALQDLSTRLPSDAVVLSNLYTDGAPGALLRQPSLLDGRAVYLEDADLLLASLRDLLGARRFFGAPNAPGNAAFLEQHGISYLVIVGPSGGQHDLGGYQPFPTDYAELENASYLQEEPGYGNNQILVFRVKPQTLGAGG